MGVGYHPKTVHLSRTDSLASHEVQNRRILLALNVYFHNSSIIHLIWYFLQHDRFAKISRRFHPQMFAMNIIIYLPGFHSFFHKSSRFSKTLASLLYLCPGASNKPAKKCVKF